VKRKPASRGLFSTCSILKTPASTALFKLFAVKTPADEWLSSDGQRENTEMA
jgi:hypothetical protein